MDENKKLIVSELIDIFNSHPELRFGQVIENIKAQSSGDLFYLSDCTVLVMIKDYVKSTKD